MAMSIKYSQWFWRQECNLGILNQTTRFLMQFFKRPINSLQSQWSWNEQSTQGCQGSLRFVCGRDGVLPWLTDHTENLSEVGSMRPSDRADLVLDFILSKRMMGPSTLDYCNVAKGQFGSQRITNIIFLGKTVLIFVSSLALDEFASFSRVFPILCLLVPLLVTHSFRLLQITTGFNGGNPELASADL